MGPLLMVLLPHVIYFKKSFFRTPHHHSHNGGRAGLPYRALWDAPTHRCPAQRNQGNWQGSVHRMGHMMQSSPSPRLLAGHPLPFPYWSDCSHLLDILGYLQVTVTPGASFASRKRTHSCASLACGSVLMLKGSASGKCNAHTHLLCLT